MKQIIIGFVIVLTVLGLSGCNGGAQAAASDSKVIELAKTFITDLNNDDYTRCLASASVTLKRSMSAAALESLWLETVRQSGSFKTLTDISEAASGEMYVCTAAAEHANMTVVYVLTYKQQSGNWQLNGIKLSVRESAFAAVSSLPAGIVEEDVVVSLDSGYPLNGKLTLPKDITGPVPAVVLIHDAGAYDMDESVYDSKPFRDIAYYLAANGVATLRYDKITYTYGDALASLYGEHLTVELETVYDAIYARILLSEDSRIDQNRVYVLGHGLGGSLAPKICARGGYSGFISMAGSLRTPVELAYDRRLYAMAGTGGKSANQSALAGMDAEAELYLGLNTMTYDEAAALTIFGQSGHYLKSWADDPPTSYASLSVPALILQGTCDFEVFFDRDFELYQAFLADNGQADFKLYEGLNHLFIWSVMENPDQRDYRSGGGVEENVMRDITNWIKKH